ncbi:MAG TPA: C39 family peptidase [Anaerolineales bacterium]|nr:C39 family peptidase [Anaerolineales bacterium]
MRKVFLVFLSGVGFLGLAVLLYQLPPVHDRLAWRVEEQVLKVKYRLEPPQEKLFVPQAAALPQPQVRVTALPTAAPPPTESVARINDPAPTQAPPTSTPVPTAEILPASVTLSGVVYQDQHGRFNYCAPANLAMALMYWDWQGDQDVVGPVIKPNPKDKNVMPYEMLDYIQSETGLKGVVRVGGDLDDLRRFLAAGYPVLVEKGVYLNDLTGVKSWMGHYQVLTGYDDEEQLFIVQDSYTGPDFEVAYDYMIQGWRAFNYLYLIVYPPEQESEVLTLLGDDADETVNYQNAALKASNEVYGLQGIDQFFAWFNRGTNLVALQDYAGAAAAYDAAFSEVYPNLPVDERPWRMVWYQTGPYFAYYYTGRYWDVFSLAENTLESMQSDKNLEESYYWRAMAKAALGDSAGAIDDYRSSLLYHPDFGPSLYQLQVMGVSSE